MLDSSISGVLYERDVVVLKRWCFFFQAEGGMRDAQESHGIGDVYKKQFLPFDSFELPLKMN